MNIAVCVKQVLDTEGHIYVSRESGSIYSANTIISPLDMLAVEEAVLIKEHRGDVRITVFCIGSNAAQKAVLSALSMGADDAVHICTEAPTGFDSYATGRVLANVISRSSYDLILCGYMAADSQAGLVGAVIAETLGISLMTSVVSINIKSDANTITVHRKINGGRREVIQTQMPAVLTIESGINKPRYPSLRSIQGAKRKMVKTIDIQMLDMPLNAIGVAGSLLRVIDVIAAKPSRKNLFVPDSDLSPLDRINALMSGGIREKEAAMITDNAQETATTFVQFVSGQKLI